MELTWWNAFETCFTYDPLGPTRIGQPSSVRIKDTIAVFVFPFTEFQLIIKINMSKATHAEIESDDLTAHQH